MYMYIRLRRATPMCPPFRPDFEVTGAKEFDWAPVRTEWEIISTNVGLEDAKAQVETLR